MPGPGFSRWWFFGALLIPWGLLPAISGCQDTTPITYPSSLTDVRTQSALRMVDILLVVDSSGSMVEEQDKLAQNFESFIAAFSDAEVDYHIGVVSTDVANQAEAGVLRGTTTSYITPETPDAEAAFEENVRVGTNGSGLEMGFDAALRALTEPLVSTLNLGFYRRDAALALVFFSDEDDLSPGSVASYLNRFTELKGPDAYRNHRLLNLSAVVGDVPYGCSSPDGSGSAEAGTRYVEAALATEGVYDSICASDFASVVAALGLDLSGLQREFVLTRCARIETLSVTVNQVQRTLGIDFEYDPSRKSIRFYQDRIPPPSAEIVIQYEYYPGDLQSCPEEGG